MYIRYLVVFIVYYKKNLKYMNEENIKNNNLLLPDNINIDVKKQKFINDVINYLSRFNEKLIYMYLEKENNIFIIYKCFHKTTDWDIKHFNLNKPYYIHFTLIYNKKYDSFSLDIEIKNLDNKNVTLNSTSDSIYNINLNFIINYYIGTLKQLNDSIKYVKSYDF